MLAYVNTVLVLYQESGSELHILRFLVMKSKIQGKISFFYNKIIAKIFYKCNTSFKIFMIVKPI